jgi:branched-chain amino acid transport system ATP-binding protein
VMVDRGEVVGLLGRNGAGKTTTLRSIMGLVTPREGSIKLNGDEIRGLPPYAIARKGIGYVPDDRCIFPDLTVWENLTLPYKRKEPSRHRWEPKQLYALFPVLEAKSAMLGGSLSGGEQQMLTVARSLMGDPDLLLLDEPVEGLAPIVVRTLGEKVKALKKEGLTILVSEQNVNFALAVCERAYVIDKGVIQYDGTVVELMGNETVKRKYLTV